MKNGNGHKFLVALEKGTAFAAVICLPGNIWITNQFTKDYSGNEVKLVDGPELLRLTKAYRDLKSQEAHRKYAVLGSKCT